MKEALNTNKTGQHGIRYTGHIVESVEKHLVFNATFNNVSYSEEHGDQFYWCLTPLSTMWQV
jgi:hypothetical protein